MTEDGCMLSTLGKRFSAAGGPKEPDPGPACSLQSGRSHAGHPERAARRPVGSVQRHGVPKVLTTDRRFMTTFDRPPITR